MAAGEIALGKFIAIGARWARTTRIVNMIRGARIASQGTLVRGAVLLGGRVADDVPVSAEVITGAMQRTAVVRQARLADDLYRTRAVLDDIGEAAGVSHARAVNYLRQTDTAGARLLLRASNRIRTFPMRTFLAIEGRVAMWRTLSRARAQNPDVGIAEVGTAMRRYGDLPRGAQRTALREWWLRAGDEGVEATARLSDDSVSTLADDAATAADGGSSLDADFRDAIARVADGDAIDDYGELDAMVQSIDDLDDAQQVSAKALFRDVGDIDDAVRLWTRLDDSSRATMTSLDTADGFGQFTRWDDWRANLARVTDDVDTAEISAYIENVRAAGAADNVQNARGLVEEVADSSDGFLGQSGEAASTMRYAEEGWEVRVEPGTNADNPIDLGVSRGGTTQYVEVKTTRDIGFQNVDEYIGDVNGKLDNARTDPSINPTSDNTVLEIQLRDTSAQSDEVSQAIQSAIDTRQNNLADIDMREIQAVDEAGSIKTFPIGD